MFRNYYGIEWKTENCQPRITGPLPPLTLSRRTHSHSKRISVFFSAGGHYQDSFTSLPALPWLYRISYRHGESPSWMAMSSPVLLRGTFSDLVHPPPSHLQCKKSLAPLPSTSWNRRLKDPRSKDGLVIFLRSQLHWSREWTSESCQTTPSPSHHLLPLKSLLM